MNDPDVAAWTRALATGAAVQLEAIYADAASAIALRGPACWASGRCCNFEAHGHRLYVTGIEAAYTVARWNQTNAALTVNRVASALDRGGCPFQDARLCAAHTIKPLGCRVYFCDRTATEWQNTLLETLHARVKALHTTGIPYEYAEWRHMLARFTS